MTTRVYQMTKVRAGLYLLPSNNGKWLFKLTLVDDLDRPFWRVEERRFEEAQAEFHLSYMTSRFQDWLHSETWDYVTAADTRRAAIDRALEERR